MNNLNEKSSAADEIIAFLLSARSTRLRHQILWERMKNRREINKNVFRQNIYRLKKKGVIKIEDNNVQLINIDSNQASKYKLIYEYPLKTNKFIIIFDIPEKDRKLRNWLRDQIKLWGFTMIQKSVWLGTGPMPKEFHKRAILLGIDKFIKIFDVRDSKDLK